MKYTIRYSRTVQVRQFESLGISLEYEFDSYNMDCDKAKDLVKSLVDRWIDEELLRLQKEQ